MTLAKLAIRQKQAQQAQRRYPQLPAGHLDHTVLQARACYGYRLEYDRGPGLSGHADTSNREQSSRARQAVQSRHHQQLIESAAGMVRPHPAATRPPDYPRRSSLGRHNPSRAIVTPPR